MGNILNFFGIIGVYKLKQTQEDFSYIVQASNGEFCIKTEHNHNSVLTDNLFEADKCDREYAEHLLEWFKIMKPEFTYTILCVKTKTEMKIQKNEQEAK